MTPPLGTYDDTSLVTPIVAEEDPIYRQLQEQEPVDDFHLMFGDGTNEISEELRFRDTAIRTSMNPLNIQPHICHIKQGGSEKEGQET